MTEETTVSTSGPDAYKRAKRMLENSGIDADDVVEVEVSVIHQSENAYKGFEDVEPDEVSEEEEGGEERTPTEKVLDGVEQRDAPTEEEKQVLKVLDDNGGWCPPEQLADETELGLGGVVTALDGLRTVWHEAIRRELPDGSYEYAPEPVSAGNVEFGPVEEKAFTREGSTVRGGQYEGSLPPGPEFEDAIRPDSQMAEVLSYLIDHDTEWRNSEDIADGMEELSKSQVSRALSNLFRREGYVKRQKDEEYGHGMLEYKATQDGKAAYEEGVRRAKAHYQEQEEEMEDE